VHVAFVQSVSFVVESYFPSFHYKKTQSIPALLVLPAVAGEFADVVAGKFDSHLVTEALAPTLYGSCGDGFVVVKFDAFDAEYVGATFRQMGHEEDAALFGLLVNTRERYSVFM